MTSRGALRVNPRHFGIDPDEPWPDDVPRRPGRHPLAVRERSEGARRAELRIAACWTLTLLASIGLAAVYVEGVRPRCRALLGRGLPGPRHRFHPLGPGPDPGQRGHRQPGPPRRLRRGGPPGGHRILIRASSRWPAVPSCSRCWARSAPCSGWPISFRSRRSGPVPGSTSIRPSGGREPGHHRGRHPGASRRHRRQRHPDRVPRRPDRRRPQPHPAHQPGRRPLRDPAERVGWNIGGLVAFSKICTHAGCPVACTTSPTTSSSARATNRPSTC